MACAPSGAETGELLDALKQAAPGTARRNAESWLRSISEETEEMAEHRRYLRRSVTFARPVDGMVAATALLPELDARPLHRTLSAIAGKPCEADARTTEQRLADGLIQLVAAYGKGEVPGGRENTARLLVASAETWAGHSQEPGRTAEGDYVSASLIRRLAVSGTEWWCNRTHCCRARSSWSLRHREAQGRRRSGRLSPEEMWAVDDALLAGFDLD